MESFDKFFKSTKLKLIIMSISTLTPILIIVIMNILKDYLLNMSNAIFSDIFETDMIILTYILLSFFEGWIIYKVIKYIFILKNKDFADKEFIKKNDERNKFMKMQANNLSGKIFLYVLVVITIFLAFTNRNMFYPLLCTLLVYLIIHFFVRIYYYKKY